MELWGEFVCGECTSWCCLRVGCWRGGGFPASNVKVVELVLRNTGNVRGEVDGSGGDKIRQDRRASLHRWGPSCEGTLGTDYLTAYKYIHLYYNCSNPLYIFPYKPVKQGTPESACQPNTPSPKPSRKCASTTAKPAMPARMSGRFYHSQNRALYQAQRTPTVF